jgi:hypothetical protein
MAVQPVVPVATDAAIAAKPDAAPPAVSPRPSPKRGPRSAPGRTDTGSDEKIRDVGY